VSQQESNAITVVIPLAPGTTIYILARLYGEKLSRRFGQRVMVSNRPGADGLIAAQAVAASQRHLRGPASP
jgi:tripartite-type tricarboxylate transporter receptor subunit TctC